MAIKENNGQMLINIFEFKKDITSVDLSVREAVLKLYPSIALNAAHWALEQNDYRKMQRIISKLEIDINTNHPQKGILMHSAVKHATSENIYFLSDLLELNPNLELFHPKNQETVLDFTISEKSPYNIIKLLLEYGAQINPYNRQLESSTLIKAIFRDDDPKIVELILEYSYCNSLSWETPKEEYLTHLSNGNQLLNKKWSYILINTNFPLE